MAVRRRGAGTTAGPVRRDHPNVSDPDGAVSSPERALIGFARRLIGELKAIEFFDQAMLLGAGLLVSLLPLLIILSAFASERVDDDIALRLGLDHRAAAIVAHLFRSRSASLNGAIITSLLFVLAGTLAVANSLQVIYERVFRCGHRRSVRRLFAWTAALCSVFAIESAVGRPVRDLTFGVALVDLMTFVLFFPFFWWTIHVLLHARIAWKELLPAAVSTAVCFVGLGIVSKLYFSSTIISDSRTYGTVGVVLCIATWLIAIGSVLILGAVAGVAWRDGARTI